MSKRRIITDRDFDRQQARARRREDVMFLIGIVGGCLGLLLVILHLARVI